MLALVAEVRPDLIVHAAAQPSHDLAAKRPFDDFDATKYGGRARQAILDAISEVARSLRLPSSESISFKQPPIAKL